MLLIAATAGFGSKRPMSEVAITVDDLPVMGPEVPGVTRMEIVREFVRVFEKYQVNGVYGFVNGVNVVDRPDNQAILRTWTAAGHPLGNHTYSHKDLGKVSFEEFSGDILVNEPVVSQYSLPGGGLFFRFPYLQEGETREKREKIRQFLLKKSYTTAEVTIDFEDWAWNEPFLRCTEKKDEDGLRKLGKLYLKAAETRLDEATDVGGKIRPNGGIKQILLLHLSAFNARMLDRLLESYREDGVKFISLQEALKDPIYQEDSGFTAQIGRAFLDQLADRKQIRVPRESEKTFRAKLNDLCR
jgi:peptidoglycan/xylan/chitin deacetylase (PgdA/CDA1 family)